MALNPCRKLKSLSFYSGPDASQNIGTDSILFVVTVFIFPVYSVGLVYNSLTRAQFKQKAMGSCVELLRGCAHAFQSSVLGFCADSHRKVGLERASGGHI